MSYEHAPCGYATLNVGSGASSQRPSCQEGSDGERSWPDVTSGAQREVGLSEQSLFSGDE